MLNQVPMIEEFQVIAKLVKALPQPPANDKFQVLERNFMQLLLLLGSNNNGVVFRSLLDQYNAEMAPFRPTRKERSFADYFSGRGVVAQSLRDEATVHAIIDNHPGDPDAVNITVNACADALDEFDYAPYEDAHELMQLTSLLKSIEASRPTTIPSTFAICDIQGGLPAALKRPGWINAIHENGSGYYENRTCPTNHDGSVAWFLVLKKIITIKNRFPLTMVLFMHQHAPCQIMFYHPQEDAWLGWDGVSLFPGIVRALYEEYAWTNTLFLPHDKNIEWFVDAVDSIKQINYRYMWQHDVLPSQITFDHEPNGEHKEFGDFMHVEDSCRLTIRSKDVWMIIYANKVANNWQQEVRFTLPQKSNVLQTYSVDAKNLSKKQKLVLVQRAYRALGLKIKAIEYEQQRQHEERNTA